MPFNEFMPIAGLLLLGYICIYSIVNRVCESFERCAYYDAYGTYMEANGNEQSRTEKGSKKEN